MSSMTPETLSRGIDAVERNARGQLIADDRSKVMRTHVPWALLLLVIVPVTALLWQALRWFSGQPVGWFGIGWLAILTCAVPAVALFVRTYMHSASVNRRQALIAMDRTLGSADRLATADDFMRAEHPNGFQKAAIEDAADWVEQGRIADVATRETQALSRQRAVFVVPLAIVLLLSAFGISGLERTAAASVAEEEPQPEPPSVTTENAVAQTPPAVQETEEPKAEEKKQKPAAKRAAKKSSSPVSSVPDEAEESRGQLTEGESSESQQSSNPSSAQGAPSSQGQPSKPDEADQKKKKKKKQKPKPNQRKPKQQEEKKEEPSGATAGQGSSRGSNNNAAANDWSSKSQQATKEDEDADSDDDAEDDDEEQESRGGVQPNMRDRRPPVNRDLNIGLGRARPNPDANGRGGPGAQKKSRGVASLILGVPIPDRITGQPNKGRTRITQQRITPEGEDSESVPAEDRGTRNGPVGPIHHPDFSPWLQDYVKKYFLKRRETADKKSDDTTATDKATEGANKG